MNYKTIREEACEANQRLPRLGLVDLTFGNAGVFDKDAGVFAVKPSGVPYEDLTPPLMVVVDLAGRVVEGDLRPSSDTPTYIEIFKAFRPRALVHTHSRNATAFAQARRPIPAFGTTHADFFFGEVPVTRPLKKSEILTDYEANTGRAIIRRFRELQLNPAEIPAALVAWHAPFVWGDSAAKAVENAAALEMCAQAAFQTLLLHARAKPVPPPLLQKHFLRKHGDTAYYGQPNCYRKSVSPSLKTARK